MLLPINYHNSVFPFPCTNRLDSLQRLVVWNYIANEVPSEVVGQTEIKGHERQEADLCAGCRNFRVLWPRTSRPACIRMRTRPRLSTIQIFSIIKLR